MNPALVLYLFYLYMIMQAEFDNAAGVVQMTKYE